MRRSQVPSIKKQRLLNQAPSGDATFRSTASSITSSTASLAVARPAASRSSDSFIKPTDTATESKPSIYQVFSVVFGVFKPNKKHKEWNDDAILVRDDKSIRIFNLEGDQIESGHCVKDKPLKRDDTLHIGSKEYMMIDPISKEDFVSGRCFQDGFSADQSIVSQQPIAKPSPIVQKSLKRKFGEYISPLAADSANPPLNIEALNSDDEELMMRESHLRNLKISRDAARPEESKKENKLYQVFTTVYGAHQPSKKHKDWEDDAILVRKGTNLTLYSMEGDEIAVDFYKMNKPIRSGEVLLIGEKQVQTGDPVEIDDFEQKHCFKVGFQARAVEEGSVRPEENQRVFKTVITSETKQALEFTSRNAHRPQEGDNDFSAFETPLFELPPPPDGSYEFYDDAKSVAVDVSLNLVLRDHQRDGILFMYKCIAGFHPDISGCILADEMGLGKTLQCIVLIYTLLKDGPFGKPFFGRVIILAPSSLVQNWAKEFEKWLKGKRNFYAYAVDGKKNTVKHFLKQPKSTYPVLIVSYDTFHRKAGLLGNIDFDLCVCDEGHRLKNSKIKIFETIKKMVCKRKIILTGTPVQNNLKELYSLSNLVNPGVLGTREEFHKNFEEPINVARKQSEETFDSQLEAHLNNLSRVESEVHFKLFSIVNQFLLRRQQCAFNYLPKKVENVVICRLTDLQEQLYNALLDDKDLKRILSEECGSSAVRSYLPYISFLRKLCNHPFLVNKSIIEKSYELKQTSLISALSPVVSRIFDQFAKGPLFKSGKFDVLAKLLRLIREVNEKVVIVSHFTQTLDLIQQYCRVKNYKTSRLDGSTPVAGRQRLVDEFNSEFSSTFAFLLSSKAGGCGLNLIGASHIVLYDIDWNPAFDLQSMARIWRDGQKKTANVYRLLTVGTIEEKIFQRQLDKQSLGTAVGTVGSETQFSNAELKDIFRLQTDTLSTTHDAIKCDCLSKLTLNSPDPKRTKAENRSMESEESVADDPGLPEFETEQSYLRMNLSNEEPDYADVRTSTQQVIIKTENRTVSSQMLFDNDDDEELNERNEEAEEDDGEGEENDGEGSESYDNSHEVDSQEESLAEEDYLREDDSNVDKISSIRNEELISSGPRPIYEDEDSVDRSDRSEAAEEARLIKYKPLIEWQHFSFNYAYDFEIDSMLLEAKEDISFLFKTVQE